MAVAVAVAVGCRRRGRRGTATGVGYVVHTQAWGQRGFIARERREHIQILLDAAECRRQPVVAGHPVDHRQRIRAFGQQYLELRLRGTRGAVEVVGLPPDDELPVGRSSQRLGKDTAAWAGTHTFIGNQIGIVREEGIQERILVQSPDPPARTLSTRTVCCRAPVKCMSPSDPTDATETGGVPYTVTGKGRAMSVVQSSQWLPISVPPAVIVPVLVAVV